MTLWLLNMVVKLVHAVKNIGLFLPLAISQRRNAQQENGMIKIRQLIIGRYATVSHIIKMGTMQWFWIQIPNYYYYYYFYWTDKKIENQCQKLYWSPSSSSISILWTWKTYFSVQLLPPQTPQPPLPFCQFDFFLSFPPPSFFYMANKWHFAKSQACCEYLLLRQNS